ncbi:MAG: TetR/AcrR family transcriptional regulator [Saprospiraceae bacterium]|nr:TetR/AcrR family transcriptional regulator [Lewinella sp.]
MAKKLTTKEKIKLAAKEIFIQKGFAGARMEDISKASGINKALLHYHFTSKENLFEQIFDEAFFEIMPRLHAVLLTEGEVMDKIDAFVDEYIATIRQNPHIPLFVIHELSQAPDRFLQKIKSHPGLPNVASLIMEVMTAMEEGKIRSYPPLHLVMNVLSMCVFPFVARPIIRTVMQVDDHNWDAIIDDRAAMIKQFIRTALKPD